MEAMKSLFCFLLSCRCVATMDLRTSKICNGVCLNCLDCRNCLPKMCDDEVNGLMYKKNCCFRVPKVKMLPNCKNICFPDEDTQCQMEKRLLSEEIDKLKIMLEDKDKQLQAKNDEIKNLNDQLKEKKLYDSTDIPTCNETITTDKTDCDGHGEVLCPLAKYIIVAISVVLFLICPIFYCCKRWRETVKEKTRVIVGASNDSRPLLGSVDPECNSQATETGHENNTQRTERTESYQQLTETFTQSDEPDQQHTESEPHHTELEQQQIKAEQQRTEPKHTDSEQHCTDPKPQDTESGQQCTELGQQCTEPQSNEHEQQHTEPITHQIGIPISETDTKSTEHDSQHTDIDLHHIIHAPKTTSDGTTLSIWDARCIDADEHRSSTYEKKTYPEKLDQAGGTCKSRELQLNDNQERAESVESYLIEQDISNGHDQAVGVSCDEQIDVDTSHVIMAIKEVKYSVGSTTQTHKCKEKS